MSRNIRQQRADLSRVGRAPADGKDGKKKKKKKKKKVVPKKRNRARVSGSWRDQDKGKCYTRTNSNGGSYTVCEGSKGQVSAPDREERGDPDQKGRPKTEAIRDHRYVIRKYDDEGRIIPLTDGVEYLTPIAQRGGIVYLSDTITGRQGYRDDRVYVDRKKVLEDKSKLIAVPIKEFNAQYRVSKGLWEVGDEYDTQIAGEYENAGANDAETKQEEAGVYRRGNRKGKEQDERVGDAIKKAGGGGFNKYKLAVRRQRQERLREEFQDDKRAILGEMEEDRIDREYEERRAASKEGQEADAIEREEQERDAEWEPLLLQRRRGFLSG